MTGRAPLAISVGDPAGIGPELIVKIWHRYRDALLDTAPFFVVGGQALLGEVCRQLDEDGQISVAEINDPAEAAGVFAKHLPILAGPDCEYAPGEPSDDGAKFALESLQNAAKLVQSGKVSALVTAPVSKSQLSKVGFDYPGQTEFLAAACGVPVNDAVMMLAGPSLRTIPMTVHCPLAMVPDLLSQQLIVDRSRVAAKSLQRDFGIENPHLAVCGLNPHAGEEGKMGREEEEFIKPAITQLQSEGIDASGPHPADTVFAPHKRGSYDAIIAMYHDQALAPMKALDFDEGVNVTLGLPIIRTSPDHGTAFDIAGQGLANPSSMLAAIKLAAKCAELRTAFDAANG